MKKLTENLVQQRLKSCTSNLDKILQINITGRELEDVAVLRKMTGVEILSLSVNHISSLSDFRYCKNLRELYLRNNKISDLEQIYYLKHLPNLKLLVLSENPCAKHPLYRMTVIKNLKNLTELDGVTIKPEERRQAQKLGKDLWSDDELCDDEPENSGTVNSNVQKSRMSDENLNNRRESDGNSGETNEEKSSFKQQSVSENGIKENNVSANSGQPFKLLCHSENDVKQSSGFHHNKTKQRNGHSALQKYSCKFCGNPDMPEAKLFSKNYNLLSATLSLIRELDYSCLQVIKAELISCLNALETE